MTKIIFVTIVNLVTPKAGVKYKLLFNKLASEVGLLMNIKFNLSSTTKCTKIISMSIVNLVTPRAGVKHKLLLNKLPSEVGLLNIKFNLSRTTNCDQKYIFVNYEFGHS